MLDQQKISLGRVRQAYRLTSNEVETVIQAMWPHAVFPVELWHRAHEAYWKDFADSCREEWQEYQKERQKLAEEQYHARVKREEEREALDRWQRERREATTARLATHGLSMLNIARHFLKEQERQEKAALREQQVQSE